MKTSNDIAVYAGTFDPITNGHVEIIERASRIFNSLIVAVAHSTAKNTLFTTAERLAIAKEAVSGISGNISVSSFDGLLVDYVKSVGSRLIVRGLRAVSDYEYEEQIAMTNRRLDANVETLYLITSESCSFISATIVKDVAKHGGDVSKFVPGCVVPKLLKAFNR